MYPLPMETNVFDEQHNFCSSDSACFPPTNILACATWSVLVTKRASNISSPVRTRVLPSPGACDPLGEMVRVKFAGTDMRMFRPGVFSSYEKRTVTGSLSWLPETTT